MSERVVPVPGDWSWEPNAPEAVLMCSDLGGASLALRCHPDDPDTRTVVLVWPQAQAAVMAPPNDEGIHAHPLYSVGLRELTWLGVVEHSRWVPPGAVARSRLRHFIAPLKECVVEVLAPSVLMSRSELSPVQAVADVSRNPA